MGDCNCKNTTTAGGICVECDIPQMARNNYFTGKLLVERDFTDEQRYYLGKFRRHDQRLHGWGAVCGLKVKEHPNPACQAQYVLIEAGYAVDCCGREIVVKHEEYFDFVQTLLANWQAQNGPSSQPDNAEHTLQICVSYKECAAENVPAIFDDCSSGGGSCHPNRIVDGYSFDVLIDPKSSPQYAGGVCVDWDCTINLANPEAVALCDATNTLYVLANPSSGGVLYAVKTTNGSVLNSYSLGSDAALNVTVSPEGDFVYVATQPATPTSQPQPDPTIKVIKSDFSEVVSTLTVTHGAGQPVRLAVVPAPDDRLLAVNSAAGALIWATDITTSSTPATPTTITVGTTPSDVVVSANGTYAYVANTGSNNVTAVTLSSLAVATVAVGSGSAAPSRLAVANTPAGDTLAVLDTTNDTLYLIGMRPDPASVTALGNPVTGFANPASGVAIDTGGRWIYVVEQDSTGKGWVQTVDEHAVELNLSTTLGTAVAAGVNVTGQIVLSENSTAIYVPYTGNSSGVAGAVAVLNISQTDCSAIFDRAIDGCPDCSDGDCIVLATIKGYKYQSAVTTSMIDNLTDRHLLVSTELLTEAVKCLMSQAPASGVAGPVGPVGPAGTNGATWFEGSGVPAAATGNDNDFYLNLASGAGDGDVYQKQAGTWTKVGNIAGPPGINGSNGTNGVGVTDVNPSFVPCSVPGAASLTPNATGLTLNLTIPGCCNTSYVGIKSVSWDKNGSTTTPLSDLLKPGLGIAFSDKVLSADLTKESIILLVPVTNGALTSWEEATLRIIPGNFSPAGDASGSFTAASGDVNGVRFVIAEEDQLASESTVRVVVKGDFIRDASANHYAIDADHLPPWLPARETGDGIEGGTFESWFTLAG